MQFYDFALGRKHFEVQKKQNKAKQKQTDKKKVEQHILCLSAGN